MFVTNEYMVGILADEGCSFSQLYGTLGFESMAVAACVQGEAWMI